MQKFSVLKRVIVVTAMVGVAMVSAAPAAEAGFLLNLSDNAGNSATITDGGLAVFTGTASGAPVDLAGPAGIIIWIGSVGVFTVNVDTGISKPIVGSPQEAVIDLNYISTAQGAGSLTMVLSDTGFSQGVGSVGVLEQSIGGTQPNGQLTALLSFKDYCNNGIGVNPITGSPFLQCQNLVVNPTQVFTASPFSGSQSVVHGVVPNNYALILGVIIVSDGAQTHGFSGNAELTNSAVPEPGSMALLGAGLLGLARKVRRKYAKQ